MENRRVRLSMALFCYGLLYCIFIIVPAFLSGYLKSPVTWGDALDFLTPLVVLPFAYLAFRITNKEIELQSDIKPKMLKTSRILFIAGFILWVDGHGLHLGANSIARFFHDSPGSKIYKAVYLFDEVISHYLWESGIFLISLSLIILASSMKTGAPKKGSSILILVGAFFYGFTFFTAGVEGQTVIFNLPVAIFSSLLAGVLFFKAKKTGFANPVFLYFGTAYLISVVLFLVWAVINGGFPEFSELGWIK
ncbi:hypothetical protein ACFLT9_01255 [Acidobacteriota bacterium]